MVSVLVAGCSMHWTGHFFSLDSPLTYCIVALVRFSSFFFGDAQGGCSTWLLALHAVADAVRQPLAM